MIINTNSIVQHVIQIKNRKIKHGNVNVKIIASEKKIVIGILAHVFMRMESIQKPMMMIQKLYVLKLYMLWIFYEQKLQILLE